jgi:hypothetical protein
MRHLFTKGPAYFAEAETEAELSQEQDQLEALSVLRRSATIPKSCYTALGDSYVGHVLVSEELMSWSVSIQSMSTVHALLFT